MTFEKTYKIHKDNKIIIQLPDQFKSKKKVRVFVEDVNEDRNEKIKLLQNASNDPLFLLISMKSPETLKIPIKNYHEV